MLQFSLAPTSKNWIPRQLLCSLSRRGDQEQIPITFGMTTIIAPVTADLAGKPTYIEQENFMYCLSITENPFDGCKCTITVSFIYEKICILDWFYTREFCLGKNKGIRGNLRVVCSWTFCGIYRQRCHVSKCSKSYGSYCPHRLK